MNLTKAQRALLPWPEPPTVYDGAPCEVENEGHRFVVANSGTIGVDTGRTRWRVECVTCTKEIHPGSTSATAQVSRHLLEVGRKRTE
jgi:hypothetical protein